MPQLLQLKLEIESKCFLPSSLAEPENGIIGKDNTIIFDLSQIKIIIYLNVYWYLHPSNYLHFMAWVCESK